MKDLQFIGFIVLLTVICLLSHVNKERLGKAKYELIKKQLETKELILELDRKLIKLDSLIKSKQKI
jgi:hypothetical protein